MDAAMKKIVVAKLSEQLVDFMVEIGNDAATAVKEIILEKADAAGVVAVADINAVNFTDLVTKKIREEFDLEDPEPALPAAAPVDVPPAEVAESATPTV